MLGTSLDGRMLCHLQGLVFCLFFVFVLKRDAFLFNMLALEITKTGF